MLTLPPDFNISLLVSEYFSLVAPFATVILLFTAYKFIIKSFNGR